MKSKNGFFSFLLLVLTMLNSSCRKEESHYEGTTPADRLQFDSNTARLLSRIAMNDGSNDNIIDNASCILFKLPTTVIANTIEIEVLSPENLDLIEDVFDIDPDDDDVLEIIFPATIILPDFTEVEVMNAAELEVFVDACGAENQVDDDIECVDIQYPIVASLFNTLRGEFDTIDLVDDRELFDFMEALEESDVVELDFPITLVLYDGVEIEVFTMLELENTIELHKDDCDEADNNDFEDDCTDCTPEEILNIWSVCNVWKVDKLVLNLLNLVTVYEEYVFTFQNDGSVNVVSGGDSFSGTWSTTGTGNDLVLTLDIPSLSDFNDAWNVLEIRDENGNEAIRLELSVGSNSLRFIENCE